MTCSYLPTPFLVILAMVQLRIDFTDFAGRISISYLSRNLQTRSWTLLNCIYDSAKRRWDTLSYWLDISWHFHGRGKLQEVGLLRNFMISSARGSQDSSTPEECVTLLAGVPAKDVMVLTKTFFTLETFGDQTKQHDTQEYYGNLWNVGTCWYMLVHVGTCWYMLVHVGTLCTQSHSASFSLFFTFIWYCDVQYQMRIRDPETHKQGNPSFHYDMPNRGMTTHPSKRSAQSLCHWLWHPSHANTHAWHIGDDVLTAHCFGPLPFPQ